MVARQDVLCYTSSYVIFVLGSGFFCEYMVPRGYPFVFSGPGGFRGSRVLGIGPNWISEDPLNSLRLFSVLGGQALFFLFMDI